MAKTRKKILINGRFLTRKITGVERYAIEIIKKIDCLPESNMFQLAVPYGTKINTCLKLKNIPITVIKPFRGIPWEQISLSIYSLIHGMKILNLCNTSPLINPGFVVLHDVMFKVYPNNYNKRFILWYNLLFYNACNRAEHIFTVSNFSKQEIIKYYHVNENKLSVVYNSWQHYEKIKEDNDILDKLRLKKYDYYFSLGSIKQNKNIKWIIDAAKNDPQETFIISGALNEKIFGEDAKYKKPKNLHFAGYLSDEEAKALSHYCKSFIFPSLYEGFGIPPLEAIAAGAQHVLVSDIPVMHEIFGDSVAYIDLNSTTIKDEYLANGINRDEILSKFSWENSAKKMVNTIVNIID